MRQIDTPLCFAKKKGGGGGKLQLTQISINVFNDGLILGSFHEFSL